MNATPLDEPDPNDVDELNDRESSYIPWYSGDNPRLGERSGMTLDSRGYTWPKPVSA